MQDMRVTRALNVRVATPHPIRSEGSIITKSIFREATLFAAVLFISACTTESKVNTISAPTAAVEATQPVALNVVQPADAQGIAVAQQVRDQLFGKLVSRGKFSEVKPTGSEARYDLMVVISDVEKVSVGARILLGVLAGGDELTATVTLTDQSTAEVISKFTVTTEAASHWLSSDYGIASAVGQLTDQIVARL